MVEKEKYFIQKANDEIKKLFIKKNNLNLLEISYKENIQEKLLSILNA